MNTDIIKDRDIVIVGQQPWDVEIGSNCKNIAIELSKHNRILYVNHPLDRITSWKGRDDLKVVKRKNVISGKDVGLINVSSTLWNLFPDVLIESINWIRNEKIFDFFNYRNNKKLAQSIGRAIGELGFRNVILFNDNDMFRSFYMKELLECEISVYYSRDYMLAVDYWRRHGERIEPLLIAKSDLCVANSTYLRDYCKKYNPNSFYIGQGCELESFGGLETDDVVDDIVKLPGKKIGYVGALNSMRLDIYLITFIAQRNPNWSIVLVGPEDEVFKASSLHTNSNVFFTGSQNQEDLPKYINSFDVCINPQILNEVTIGNYPRKIDEYLAVGKAVVATETQALDIFADCVYLAKDNEDFVRLLQEALDNDSLEKQQKRKLLASSHSWENSVAELYKAINKFI